MFEEVCLACGKHLQDDGSPYCSDECFNYDTTTTSPSISSASSVYSSPFLGHATGGEVPPLLPSDLGYALKGHSRDRKSISSSSASSTAWSLLTDDEDDSVPTVASDHSNIHEYPDTPYEHDFNSPKLAPTHKLSRLSYARLPSGTNNRSAVAHLHRRTSSSSFASNRQSTRGGTHSSTEDEDIQSDHEQLSVESSSVVGYSSSDRSQTDDEYSGKEANSDTLTRRQKRNQNRSSLPAYFSLLQTSSSPRVPGSHKAPPSLASTSGQTISYTRHSPPTPKISLSRLNTTGLALSCLTAPPTAVHHPTPRGRRREVIKHGEASSHSSRSPSLERSCITQTVYKNATRMRCDNETSKESLQHRLRKQMDNNNSSEQSLDWSSSVPDLPPTRGRPAFRRNSSPPVKMIFSFKESGLNGDLSSSDSPYEEQDVALDGYPRKVRGRARVYELDGVGGHLEAPGFGHGRSGLIDREQKKVDRARP